ncbi:MAG: GHMP kinase [Pseudonocardiaceae bacterium]|nr:GHMP kinase [Pseudonocardiaceae bacterium]
MHRAPRPGAERGERDGVNRGSGYAPCHHGEILQGVFRDHAGVPCRGLVTLPMADLGTYAEFVRQPDRPAEQLTVSPADRSKALRATADTVPLCARLARHPVCGGQLRLTSHIPVGLGMGSSTSDIIAAVRAVAASFGVELAPATIARLAVRAERASDPLMLENRPLLFAQREGQVLEVLGASLPRVIVVGCTTGGGRPVDTLALPPVEHTDVDTFELLRTALRRAITAADPALLGWVSTESARSNQRLLVKEELGVLEGVADAVGAVGVQVAHSGNVAGVLFDPATRELRRRLRQCVHALRGNGITVSRVFRSDRYDRYGSYGKGGERVRAHRGLDQPAGPGARRRRLGVYPIRDDEGRLGVGRGAAAARRRGGATR